MNSEQSVVKGRLKIRGPFCEAGSTSALILSTTSCAAACCPHGVCQCEVKVQVRGCLVKDSICFRTGVHSASCLAIYAQKIGHAIVQMELLWA